ncbi:MAG: hypothetical protein LBP59_05145 [Planctomycetaceae bacterium]|nr:hypothetical protein [Planctomycetaceae bacterium]
MLSDSYSDGGNRKLICEPFKLFALEFAFTFACLAFGRQAFTLLNH